MTESDIPPVQIRCQQCGNELGEEIIVAGMTLFHAGGLVLREMRGWCAQCGRPWYWHASDNQMQVVIKGLKIFGKATY